MELGLGLVCNDVGQSAIRVRVEFHAHDSALLVTELTTLALVQHTPGQEPAQANRINVDMPSQLAELCRESGVPGLGSG